MTHEIKLNIHYCDAVLSGEKNFEVRVNDRGYQKGDYIRFRPWDGMREVNHPVENMTYRIKYVYAGLGLEYRWVVLAIEAKSEKEAEDDSHS